MKVFAEFHAEHEVIYRKMTILQFGESWDLIGSTILINPGSSKVGDQLSGEELARIKDFDNRILSDNWFKFTPDPTMQQIEKIFNGYYTGRQRELNGTILLFNLFNLKEQDLKKATSRVKESHSDHLYPLFEETFPFLKEQPVYLGWSSAYREHNEVFAQRIFDYLKNSNLMYLENEMGANKFYHPRYINMGYRRNSKVSNMMERFFNLYQ